MYTSKCFLSNKRSKHYQLENYVDIVSDRIRHRLGRWEREGNKFKGSNHFSSYVAGRRA